MTTEAVEWRSRIVRHAQRKPEAIHANPGNWRSHPEAQRVAMREMLDTVGWVQDVVVNVTTGHLIDGHLRVELAVERGEKTIPVVEVQLTETEEALVLASLDPLSAMATVDTPRLESLLESLDLGTGAMDEMLRDLGARSGIASMLAQPEAKAPADPDDAPPVRPQRAVTVKRGELYKLGAHRLLCGDTTSPEDVARLMGGERARMCFTDPPWNVAIGKDSNPRHRQRPGLVGDDMSEEDFAAFIAGFSAAIMSALDGDVYCVLGASEWPALDRGLRAAGFHWSATIIWVKHIFVLGRSMYHRRYEPLWYGWSAAGKSSFSGGRSEDDVWEIPRPTRSEDHPTMKPIALVERAMRNSSEIGDPVLDPFLGSGTTLIAAERLGRRCFGMEIDPQYAQVIIDRWEAYTGQKAERIE